MNQYNIAVCTYTKAIDQTSFYQLIDLFKSHYKSVTIFNHSLIPDYNLKLSSYNIEVSTNSNLFGKFNDILIDDKLVLAHKKTIINNINLLYSMYRSILNKKFYEASNNVRYDIVYVINSSIDVDRYINKDILINQLSDINSSIKGAIYKNKKDYGLFSIEPSFIIGESRYIDILGSMFEFYKNNSLWKVLNIEDLSNSVKYTSLNTLLYKWLSIRNIRMENIN